MAEWLYTLNGTIGEASGGVGSYDTDEDVLPSWIREAAGRDEKSDRPIRYSAKRALMMNNPCDHSKNRQITIDGRA